MRHIELFGGGWPYGGVLEVKSRSAVVETLVDGMGVAMSMRPRASVEIPEETARIVRAACPKGTRAPHLRDALGPIFTDEQHADWFAPEGRSGVAPGILAMVCVLQSMEQRSVPRYGGNRQ